MPPGWIHETIDMIAWGRVYWSVHNDKDRYWRELGTKHRIMEHPLYQKGLACVRGGMPLEQVLNFMYDQAKERTQADWGKRLPADLIEARQAGMAHDCWDLLWDDFTPAERRGIAGAFMDVVLRPEAYPNLFMPDDYLAMRGSGSWQRLQTYVRSRQLKELI